MRQVLTSVLAIGFAFWSAASWASQRVFFDDAETGAINSKWDQDSTRAMCRYVSNSHDGVKHAFAGSKMIECNDPGPGSNWETLKAKSFSMNQEVLYRVRLRVDNDNDDTSGSTRKTLRIFYFTGDRSTYVDLMTLVPGTGPSDNEGLYSDVIIDDDRHPVGSDSSLYWGDAAGDHTKNTSAWHTIEYYLNKSTGLVRVWHDDVLVQSGTFGPIQGEVGANGEFYITSNWEDAHDTANHVYFDNVEIFTDTGTATVTGTLANGDVELMSNPVNGKPGAPTNLRIQ